MRKVWKLPIDPRSIFLVLFFLKLFEKSHDTLLNVLTCVSNLLLLLLLLLGLLFAFSLFFGFLLLLLVENLFLEQYDLELNFFPGLPFLGELFSFLFELFLVLIQLEGKGFDLA